MKPACCEPARVRRRRLEREAVRRARAALRAAAGGERALEVPEHDVAGEVGLDVGEERAARRRAAGSGVEPITMSPVATIATTPCGTLGACGFASCGRRLRLRGRLLDGSWVAAGGRRLRPAVDEQREHERARGHDGARAHDQRDHPHDERLVAVAEEDERVVRELRQRGERGGDVRHRGGGQHLARALRLAGR